MRPSPRVQVVIGLVAAVGTLAVICLLAFAPNPWRTTYVTTFDDVDGIARGAPVYFRGAAVGEVRSVELVPDEGLFAVTMAVRRDWRPPACAHARILAPLPVTAPRVELAGLCAPQTCEALAAPADGGAPLPGCRRDADLLKNATAALAEVTALVRNANLLTADLQRTMDGDGRRILADASTALAAASQISERLNRNLAPGRGDAAVALANLRTASGRAAEIDVAQLNATVAEVRALVRRNEANVNTLLSEGASLSTESRALLQNVSGTLASAGSNLERASGSLDALSERVGDDPTFVVRGQRYADPPPPGASR